MVIKDSLYLASENSRKMHLKIRQIETVVFIQVINSILRMNYQPFFVSVKGA
jgi:hypothetical protein